MPKPFKEHLVRTPITNTYKNALNVRPEEQEVAIIDKLDKAVVHFIFERDAGYYVSGGISAAAIKKWSRVLMQDELPTVDEHNQPLLDEKGELRNFTSIEQFNVYVLNVIANYRKRKTKKE